MTTWNWKELPGLKKWFWISVAINLIFVGLFCIRGPYIYSSQYYGGHRYSVRTAWFTGHVETFNGGGWAGR